MEHGVRRGAKLKKHSSCSLSLFYATKMKEEKEGGSPFNIILIYIRYFTLWKVHLGAMLVLRFITL
jgi:hypothetical protein